MSTWTSKVRRAGLAALAAGLLPGCMADLGLPFPLAAPVASPAAEPEPPVLGGAVAVAAPAGWCADPRSGLAGDAGDFLLLGPCRGAAAPPAPVILTVSVLGAAEAGDVAPERMEGFFRSEVGRAALSRSGDPASVTILQTGIAGDGYFLHVRDTAEMAGARVAPEAWRAVLPLSGRLVALTALSPAEPRVPPATLRAVLDAFVARMRAANAPVGAGAG